MFAIVLALEDYFGGRPAVFLGLCFAAPFVVFLIFLFRGCYPELQNFRPGLGGLTLDILFGLLVMAIWVAPYLIWPGLRPSSSEAFDAGNSTLRPLLLTFRFLGFALVTPFIEELLVRSYLIRAVDLYPSDRDFREIPVGAFAWRSFLFTVAWFTLTHAMWEWPVAFVTGILYNLWLYRRRHIGSLILAHAVTNASLFFVVMAAGQAQGYWNLWFFL